MTHKVLFLQKCCVKSGGVERVHQNLAKALLNVNVGSSFYVMNIDGESQEGFKSLKAEFDASGGDSKTTIPKYFRDIKHLVKAKQISVIVAATERANLLAFFCKILMPKVRVIYSRHCAFDVSDQILSPWMIKALYSLYALNGQIVAVSQCLQEQIKACLIVNKHVVHFVPNAVIDNILYTKALEPLPLNISEPYLLAVGRLVEQKGFDLLISAYAKALALDPKLPILIIAGEGEDRDKLEQQIKQENLKQNVILYGFTDNPYNLINNACCFVLSSRHEGMPTVMIESLALNIPVIAFDCPTGPSEIIKTKDMGTLVEYLNVNALTHAILAHAKAPRENLAASVSDFGFTNVAKKYLKLFGAS
jgi:glycosyltransferase involved in cell wall biosynthesis